MIFPQAIIKLIALGETRYTPTDFIFAGRHKGAHVYVGTIDRIVRTTAIMARLIKPVTVMTLHHTYAVHQLQARQTSWSDQGNSSPGTKDRIFIIFIIFAC